MDTQSWTITSTYNFMNGRPSMHNTWSRAYARVVMGKALLSYWAYGVHGIHNFISKLSFAAFWGADNQKLIFMLQEMMLQTCKCTLSFAMPICGRQPSDKINAIIMICTHTPILNELHRDLAPVKTSCPGLILSCVVRPTLVTMVQHLSKRNYSRSISSIMCHTVPRCCRQWCQFQANWTILQSLFLLSGQKME